MTSYPAIDQTRLGGYSGVGEGVNFQGAPPEQAISRTGDRTVAHRAERIAATKGNLYRLLPAPRVVEHHLFPEWDIAEEVLDLDPPR